MKNFATYQRGREQIKLARTIRAKEMKYRYVFKNNLIEIMFFATVASTSLAGITM